MVVQNRQENQLYGVDQRKPWQLEYYSFEQYSIRSALKTNLGTSYCDMCFKTKREAKLISLAL